ncbi:unnamed protein product [Brassica napus]|uniref:(rape) hypothetical protein n=1 Tax=Brassica napus TaxID=3708 RepID=A0A817AHK6_BRANA|nr:unnamed protein product [Brassica napus]
MLRLPLADLKNSLTLFNEPQLCKRRGHELTTEPLKLLAAVYSIICPVDSISDTAKKHATKENYDEHGETVNLDYVSITYF